MRRRLLGDIDYATDIIKTFTVTSEVTQASPLSAFQSNANLFPDLPAENETLFIEMVCTKEDYSEYASINDAPVYYLLGIYNANSGIQEETSIKLLFKYGNSSKLESTNTTWNKTDGKARPFSARKGFIEGLTYNVRYWYVPFIVGSYDLLGGN